MDLLHIVGGAGALRALREALHDLARDDEVVAHFAPLDVGPLWDIESDGQARAAFWKEVEPAAWRPDRAKMAAHEALGWATLAATDVPVVVWRGPTPREHLLALRVAALLESKGVPIYDVIRPPTGRADPYFDAVEWARPEQLVALFSTRTLVRDVSTRAAEWRRLCASRDACFRVLGPDGIVELGEDAYDELIVEQCTNDWTSAVQVIVGLLARDLHVGDMVLLWRLRALVAKGVLEKRGRGRFRHRSIEVRLHV